MLDLTNYLKKVWSSLTVEDKRKAAIEMVTASHAKSETKANAIAKFNRMTQGKDIDRYASDYSFAGEGSRVIK